MINFLVVLLLVCFTGHVTSLAYLELSSNNSRHVIDFVLSPLCRPFPRNNVVQIVETRMSNSLCVPIESPQLDWRFLTIIAPRGGCPFEVKIRHANAAGFQSILVSNYPGDDLVPMVTDVGYDIFAAMISESDATKLIIWSQIESLDNTLSINFTSTVQLPLLCLHAFESFRSLFVANLTKLEKAVELCAGQSLVSSFRVLPRENCAISDLVDWIKGIELYLRWNGKLPNAFRDFMLDQMSSHLIECARRYLDHEAVSDKMKLQVMTIILDSIKYFSDISRFDLMLLLSQESKVWPLKKYLYLPQLVPYVKAICSWFYLTWFSVGLEVEISGANSVCIIDDGLIRSLLSLPVATSSDLWLPWDELKYASKQLGNNSTAHYCKWALSKRVIDENKSQIAVSKLSGNIFKIFAGVHSKLGVYWDELGCSECSHRHLLLYSQASKWLLYSNESSTLLGITENCKAHLIETVVDKDVCLQLRYIFGSPVIFDNQTHVVEYYVERYKELSLFTSLNESFTAPFSDHVACLASLRARWALQQYMHSQTMSSMMIGYDADGTAQNGWLMAHLLSRSHFFHSFCLLGAPSTAAPAIKNYSNHSRLKIAFVGNFFFDHSVGRLISPVILSLSRELFHVTVVVLHSFRNFAYEESDEVSRKLYSSVETWLSIPILLDFHNRECLSDETAKAFTLRCARQKILSLHADVVIYPELGMDLFTGVIARSQRFAPVQCTFWGHPIAQHIPFVDYFISSVNFEVNITKSEFHASQLRLEQTVLFDSLTTIFQFSADMKTGKHKPLPSTIDHIFQANNISVRDKNIYFLPHTLMKFSVSFTRSVASIMSADERSLIICVFAQQQNIWKLRLSRRVLSQLQQVLGFRSSTAETIFRSRLLFLPRLEKNEYLDFLSNHVNVVLDSFPFGMGITALDALAANVPVVTLPSEQTVPALAAGMIMKMGEDLAKCLVASSQVDYTQKAITAAASCVVGDGMTCCREVISQAIDLTKTRVLNDAPALKEWENFLLAVTGGGIYPPILP